MRHLFVVDSLDKQMQNEKELIRLASAGVRGLFCICVSWRYRLGVALSIDIPYLRALFIALSLMVQVVASLLFFCLFVFSSFLYFSLLFIGKLFLFGSVFLKRPGLFLHQSSVSFCSLTSTET